MSRPPPDSTVPAFFASLLYSYLDEKGPQYAQLSQLARPSKGHDPLDGIPAKPFCDELIRLSEALKEPAMGIHIGARIRLRHLGHLGRSLANCGTVAEAMVTLMRLKDVLHPMHDMDIRFEGARVVLEWPVNSWFFGRVFDELGLAVLVQLTRELTGVRDLVSKIEFVNRTPESILPYQSFFGGTLLFGRPATKAYAKAIILSRVLARPGADISPVIDDTLSTWPFNNTAMSGFEKNVRRAVAQVTRDGFPSIERVANKLELSSRQFARKLGDQGLNFRDLRDDTLRQLAEHYVTKHHLRLTQISQLLGYSEQSAFSRTVKRWTGQSAREWRKGLLRHSE